MYRTINAEMNEDGQIVLREPLTIIGRRRVLVTVMDVMDDDENEDNRGGNSRRVLELLDSPDFQGSLGHSSEEIEAIIHENRNAWGD